MKYFKLKYIFLFFTAIFFVVIFCNFLNVISFADSSLNFEGEGKQEKIYPNAPLIQKITAKENNLNQINISINKFSHKLGDKINLEIMDEACAKTLAESKINSFTWYSPSYNKFRFKTIPDSKDKIYCLRLTYVPFGKVQDKKPYITSYSSEGSSYINQGKSIAEQKNRTLKLKPAYGNGSFWQDFSRLIDRMSQYKPNFLKGCSLAIIFIFSFVFIILFTVLVIII